MASQDEQNAPKLMEQDLKDSNGTNLPRPRAATATARDVSLSPPLRRLSTADSSVNNELPPLSVVSTTESAFSEGTIELRALDRALENSLKDEEIPMADDATTIKPEIPNPYHNWECGFGFMGQLDAPKEIPNTKAEFLQAVKGEITTIGFIQNGLASYVKAINSGVHHDFSKEFLKTQDDATHKTIGQLFRITNNLKDVVKEVEAVEDDCQEVKAELKAAYAHAQPWIQRTRAILVSAHVFYKINYVLGSDKTKHGA